MRLKQKLIRVSVFALVGFVALVLILQSHLPNSVAKDESIDDTVVKSLTTRGSTLGTHGAARDNKETLSNYKEVQNVTAATEVVLKFEDSWNQWRKWVRQDSLYPEDAFWSPDMTDMLLSLATAPVTSFGLGHKGTQLKATMQLAGGQKAVFKPMRSRTSTLFVVLVAQDQFFARCFQLWNVLFRK